MKSVVFMGTPDFAVPALKTLIDSDDYDVKLVISQPDKPQGRKQILTAPPVKALAMEHEIEVYQPDSLKTDEAYNKIASFSPDFIVVSAYGKLLPKRVLDIPKYGCVNLHGSLLPKYRGAAPIQWSVINGDKETGVTTMLMNVGLDTGDILLTEKKTINENETAGEVFDALASICPALLLKTLKGLVDGTVVPIKQNDEHATYVSMLSKDMSVIKWNESAQSIHDLIRGMNPWPVARTMFNGKILKIYSSLVTEKKSKLEPGTVMFDADDIFVSCADGILLQLLEVQLEGSKRMFACDFMRGHSDINGYCFSKE